MPNPGTDIVASRVFEAVLDLARSGNDDRAFSNSTHTGLEVETQEYGLITVALRHDLGGTPVKYIAAGASISQVDDVPIGEMEPDGAIISETVSYTQDGKADGEIKSAPLMEVLAAVSNELRKG